MVAYYEAGRIDTLRKQRKESGSGNVAVRAAGWSMVQQARHLDQNHDLSRGILNTLVANVVGSNGVTVEPQPRTRDGKIHEPTARRIKQLRADWNRRPEVTWRHDWPAAERIGCRTWLRDGEVLGQHIEGLVPSLQHGTRVPYSIELLEPDYLPMDLDNVGDRIIQGCETNAWGRVIAYHLYLNHPGDSYFAFSARGLRTKRVPADRIMHIALRDRLHQMRGVTVFAPVMLRLDDVKDYEDSERIAAKVAASMAAAIIKGSPEHYEQPLDPETGEPIEREMRMRAGLIFDELYEGERIETIDTKRPNVNLEAFRRGQLRAVASGTYCTYSSLAKDYDGSYSAQRQELVEGYGVYGILQSEWIGQCSRPVHERFIQAALASGELLLDPAVDPFTVADAMYIAPQMPWIDPLKEANAWEVLERNGHASGPEIVRKRGRDPSEVYEQETGWREKWREGGHVINTDPAATAGTQMVIANETPQNDQGAQGRLRIPRGR